MATQSVQIEFMCDGSQPLRTINREKLNAHLIPSQLLPRTLITNAKANPSDTDPQYMNTFVSTIRPILSMHMKEAFEACTPTCCICGSPPTIPQMTPMSWLHTPEPFINVIVCPICEKPGCDTASRQEIQVLMLEMAMQAPRRSPASNGVGGNGEGKGRDGNGEVKPCRACGKIDGKNSRCIRCGVAFYCGKEHQRLDWKVHKKACKASAWDGWDWG